jgi:hypothetical protein
MQSNKENDHKCMKYDKEASGHVTVLRVKITGLLNLERCSDVGKCGL